jgi:hypothetical protein
LQRPTKTTIVVIGGRPDSALPPSPFEFWYAALPAERAGDLEQAHDIVAEGLKEWPDHGTIHYVLGSLCARMGRRDGALEPNTAGTNSPLGSRTPRRPFGDTCTLLLPSSRRTIRGRRTKRDGGVRVEVRRAPPLRTATRTGRD